MPGFKPGAAGLEARMLPSDVDDLLPKVSPEIVGDNLFVRLFLTTSRSRRNRSDLCRRRQNLSGVDLGQEQLDCC